MQAGVIRFKFVDNASDKKEVLDWVEPRRYGLSPAERQRRFLEELHSKGYEPFDMDADGYQYWRRPQPSTVAE